MRRGDSANNVASVLDFVRGRKPDERFFIKTSVRGVIRRVADCTLLHSHAPRLLVILTPQMEAAYPFPQSSAVFKDSLERLHKDMLFVIAAILIVLWGLGFIAFRVASSFIHLLLIIGVILLALHFLRR